MKSIIKKTLERWFLNADGEISLTKVGLNVGAAGVAVVALPASLATAGIVFVLPPVVIAAGQLAILVGGLLAGTGARDAIDKGKK